LKKRIVNRGLLPMITEDALSALKMIFEGEAGRITASELAQHPFCNWRTTQPNKK